MTHIILSLVLVSAILFYWFYLLLNITFINTWKRYRHISGTEGLVRTATIVGKKELANNNGIPFLECEFEFPNFSEENIREKMKFSDSKPHLKRYEIGQKIEVLLNKEQKPRSPLNLKGINVTFNKKIIILKIIVLTAYWVGTIYYMKRAIEKVYSNTEHYEMILELQGLPMMAFMFLGILLFNFFLIRAITRSKKPKHLDWDLKYYGKKAIAQIQKYEDTGTLINDNPLVRFHYSFEASDGKKHQGSDEKIINKLDIGNIPQMKEEFILYLPEHPESSKFEGDAQSLTSINNFVKGIFFLVGIVFSAIIVFLFFNTIS